MGADSSIFDRRTKTRYYFDRDSNYRYAAESDRALELVKKLDQGETEYPGSLNQAEVIELAKLNIEYWKAKGEHDAHRITWNENIIAFAQTSPRGKFFVVSDHQSPDCHDYEDRGYIEWVPGIAWAIAQMQEGKRMRRRRWNGEFVQWVAYAAAGSPSPSMTNDMIVKTPLFYVHTDDGTNRPWIISQKDLLWDDWIVVEQEA